MPMYEYQNKDGEIIERMFSMKGKIPSKIIENKKTYTRIYSVPSVIMDATRPKTIGSLAEKNTEKMVKEGKLKKPKKEKNPWWRPNKDKPNLNLSSMSAKKKQDYIFRGTK